MDRRRQQPRQRAADQYVGRLVGVLADRPLRPGELVIVEHRAPTLGQYAAAPGVQDDQPHPVYIPAKAPSDRCEVGVRGVGHLSQHWPGVAAGILDGAPGRVGVALLRGQVADVLIHPVGGQRAADSFGPPGRSGDPGAPRRRGVPVVAHIVVIEDHRSGHGGHQPPELGV
ncbi:MAG: hypothetical protein ACRDRO_25390 [Pseudonocardiaceae bacterium]